MRNAEIPRPTPTGQAKHDTHAQVEWMKCQPAWGDLLGQPWRRSRRRYLRRQRWARFKAWLTNG